MNQILSTGEKNNNTMEIKKVIKIFMIGIIIYGAICLIEGSYGIIKNIQVRKNMLIDPHVTLEQINTEGVLQLKIKHNKAIDKIIYSWNNEQENTLQGMGRKEIVENIQMPDGQNNLSLRIIDNKGHEVNYTNNYYYEKIDNVAPEIELLIEDAKVKIIARDETKIDHISYYWNDEDETVINVREESELQIEEKIQILKGQNTLTVIAVDANGNESKKEQTYIGAKKPTITHEVKNGYLYITVKDEDNIKKIEYNYEGQEFSTDKSNSGQPLNMKEARCKQKLEEGTSTITIRAYNVSGLVTEVTEQFTR